jgi:hypothetical protein
MKRYYGNYIGIVIQNNDPEFRGRVKVWVPYVSATVYENWNQDRKDKKFKFLGKNVDSPVSGQLLDDLKNILPWAEYVAPSMGAAGSGTYNATQDAATISDSNNNEQKKPIAEADAIFKNKRFNTDNVGEKSGKIYETDQGAVSDAFTTTSNGGSKVNTNGFNYKPSTYSNAAKGSFSIPNVGAHVTVFYMEGNPMYPYYFGVAFGQDDFASIFNPSQNQYEDYPQSYENAPGKTGDAAETYRNKYVFSQKGGTFEIVNTDKRESLKLTHYSGSFKEFNNNTGVELFTGNNQKLVLGDEFLTNRGYLGLHVGRDYEIISNGNHRRKIGNVAKTLVDQWVAAYQDIANTKGLFEIRRAPFVSSRLSAPGQVRSGSFGNCPTCGGSGTVFGDTCGTCGGTGQSPSSQSGTWAAEASKAQLVALIQSKAQQLAEIEKKMGRGGSELTHIAKHKFESIGLVLNKFNAVRIDPVGTLDTYAVTIAQSGVYTQRKAFPIFEKVHVDDLPGGTFTHFIGNKYDAVVGAGGYRVKTLGNVDIAGAITTFIGDQIIIGSSNEVTVDGGKRVNIVGDSINLKSRLGKQITADGNFGVVKNVVIGGGAHIEGELNVHHVTAPLEFQITEPVHIKTTFTIRDLNIPSLTQADGANKPIQAPSMTGEIELDIDHTHYFRNLPLTLVDGKNGVRDDSKTHDNTDSSTPRASKDREDGRKASFQSSNKGPDNGPPPNS